MTDTRAAGLPETRYPIIYVRGFAFTDDGAKRLKEGIEMASIVIHRYYDAGSTLRGTGDASPIDQYAQELASLIAMVRELVRPRIKEAAIAEGTALTVDEADARFACYLVAHSMGGLVVRALLQNPTNDVPKLTLQGQAASVRPVRSHSATPIRKKSFSKRHPTAAGWFATAGALGKGKMKDQATRDAIKANLRLVSSARS